MAIDPLELLKSLVDLTVFDYLREVFPGQPWVEPVIDIVGILVVSSMALLSIFFWGLLERKVIARMQDRIGPNRVGGRYGQLQMVADVIKMITKEVIIPDGADKVSFMLAPIVGVATALLLLAVLPFAPGIIGTDLNVGLLYIMGISSISVVTFILAGWGSNNKYALLGAFRSVAQLVSYEVPLVIAFLIPAMLASTLSTVEIVVAQTIPFILVVPLAALIFFISALAETGRTPFDLLEAESEIVAGYHTEYTGMSLGLFLAGEYIGTLFMSALFSTLFLGGYRFLGLETLVIGDGIAIGRVLGLIIIFIKTFLVFFAFMWIRGTLPRFRIDQMLNFNWKVMVPMSLVLILVVAIIEKTLPADTAPLIRVLAHFASNIVLFGIVLSLLRRESEKQRVAFEAKLAKRTAENQQRAAEVMGTIH
jgi:NADH-quinone oxidoreductase subunit H